MIAIIGAGLSGLACAGRLQKRGINCQILERSQSIGGRVQTELVDDHVLDRGFQVLLTAYPQARQTLDLGGLELKGFNSGAVVRWNKRFHVLSDPLRHPSDLFFTAFSPLFGPADKMRILKLRGSVCRPPLEQILARPEVTTMERLREFGFSDQAIERFFRPFLGGIFLEPDLVTSSRKFEFVFRMFSVGQAVLPRLGMQAIPQQLADRLRPGLIRTNAGVDAILAENLRLSNGQIVKAERVVVATSEATAMRLLGRPASTPMQAQASCHYYSAASSPIVGPWLVLNGDGQGPINNLCVPTEIHRSLGPVDRSLVSVTVLGPPTRTDESAVRAQLVQWFGQKATEWRHLRTYEMAEALPLQSPPTLTPVVKPVRLSDRLFLCGDHTDIASIEGAIASGLRAADAVAETL